MKTILYVKTKDTPSENSKIFFLTAPVQITYRQAFDLAKTKVQVTFEEFTSICDRILQKNKHCILISNEKNQLYLTGISSYNLIPSPPSKGMSLH